MSMRTCSLIPPFFLHSAEMISIALSAMFVATVVASRMTVGLIDMSISLGTSDTTLFNSELANIFAADFSAIPSLNSSIKLDNSLAVPVFMWFSGFPVDSRDATAQLLRSNFTVLWPVAGNLPLNLTLVDACTNVLGVAPTSISYSDECIYSSLAPSSWTTASPSATSFVDCERSVAFVLHFSNNVGGAIVKNYVCSSLEIDCSKIVVGSTTAISYSTGSTDVSGFQVLVNVSMIDPMEITSLLCDRAASASQLSFLYDLMISINGVMIFTRGSVIQDSSDGSFQDCMENLWYLLILILLVPISYVVTSMCYQRGKRRGRVVAQDQDEEAKEKAKQMLSQQNWQSLYFPQGTQGFGSMPSR